MDRYEKLDNTITNLKQFLSKESGKKERIVDEINKIEYDIKKTKERIDVLEKVNILLQKTSKFAREQSKKQIEVLVTNCLQYVFDSYLEFKIEIEELYGKPSAQFYVITNIDNQVIKTKPELSRGGGIIDIISLALRIAFLQVHKPPIEGPLILDEPAKHVSEDYIFNVASFLKNTSEMFNRQVIMVTHNVHLSSISTNVYKIKLRGTNSCVEKVDTY